MYTAQITLKPIINSIELSQHSLDLTDAEMEDSQGLTEYVKEYFTPEGFEVVSVLTITP